MTDRIAESVLDLLAAWQSVHAVLPPHLRAELDDLNEQTLAVLREQYARIDGPGCG